MKSRLIITNMCGALVATVFCFFLINNPDTATPARTAHSAIETAHDSKNRSILVAKPQSAQRQFMMSLTENLKKIEHYLSTKTKDTPETAPRNPHQDIALETNGMLANSDTSDK